MLNAADLPDDIAALKAMLIAATAREVETVAQIARKDERVFNLMMTLNVAIFISL